MFFLLSFCLWASAQKAPFLESQIIRKYELRNNKPQIDLQFLIVDDHSLWVRPLPLFGHPSRYRPTRLPLADFSVHEFFDFHGHLFVIAERALEQDRYLAEIKLIETTAAGPIRFSRGAPYITAAGLTGGFMLGALAEHRPLLGTVYGGLSAGLALRGWLACRPVACKRTVQQAVILRDKNNLPFRIRDIVYNPRDYSIRDMEIATSIGLPIFLSEFLAVRGCNGILGKISAPSVVPND
jgi:hypothetical protein